MQVMLLCWAIDMARKVGGWASINVGGVIVGGHQSRRVVLLWFGVDVACEVGGRRQSIQMGHCRGGQMTWHARQAPIEGSRGVVIGVGH